MRWASRRASSSGRSGCGVAGAPPTRAAISRQATRRLLIARSKIEGAAGVGTVSAMRALSPEWSAGPQPSTDLIEFRYVEAGAPSPECGAPLAIGSVSVLGIAKPPPAGQKL